MSGLEDSLNNKKEESIEANLGLENQESFETVEDMKDLILQEINNQNEQLLSEDQKIETANDTINLSQEEVDQERQAINLDVEILNINSEAEKLTNESKEQINSNEEVFKTNIDESYIQHDINAFLSSPEIESNTLEGGFLKNYQTKVKKEDFEKITPYIRSEHQTINGLLRQDKEITIENVLQYKGKELNDINKEWNTDIVDSFKALEDSIEKSQLTVPEQGIGKEVYRVINGNYLSEYQEGDVITEKSFLSTSIDESYKKHYLNDSQEETVLTIIFPKNSTVNGIYLGNVEKEFLLPRNMSYKIINKKVAEINGVKKFEIEAEFLPNKNLRIVS